MKWLLLLSLFGCAQVTSLNLQKHQFGVQPGRIIWFQIAGLEEEQLAMLRFEKSGEVETSFEQNTCMGNTWNYNLFNLRNPAQASFLSQITGKKNISMTCADAELRPIWGYLVPKGYNTGIIETGATKEQSILSLNSCGEKGLAFLSEIYIWLRQEAPANAQTYHFSDIPLQTNQLYFDRTCNSKNCSSTIAENVRPVYQKLKGFSHKHMLIVRDFSYLSALEKGDLKEAKRVLSDLEKAYSEALSIARDSSDTLVLLTTGDSRFVDFPDQGKNWFEFERTSKGAAIKRTKLTNLLFATGARAENFCGIFDDSAVFERILSGPKQQGLEFKIINPFK
jgi:hypothetical protein